MARNAILKKHKAILFIASSLLLAGESFLPAQEASKVSPTAQKTGTVTTQQEATKASKTAQEYGGVLQVQGIPPAEKGAVRPRPVTGESEQSALLAELGASESDANSIGSGADSTGLDANSAGSGADSTEFGADSTGLGAGSGADYDGLGAGSPQTDASTVPAESYEIPGQNYTVKEPPRTPLGIPGADHPLTKKFRDQYLSEQGQKFLVTVLEASAPYRPYIQQRLEESGMPLFLQYLPVVESNFKTNAVSRTGATGMWQFMENSMAPFLHKNAWYDERLDPWLSTDAALKKLTDNYKMFGDWALALAAYNCGAGALSRILRASPGADFWTLAENGKLRDQTKNYVPKLLAIADVIENAEHYGALEVHLADMLAELPAAYSTASASADDSNGTDGAKSENAGNGSEAAEAPHTPAQIFAASEKATVIGMYSLNQIAELSGIPAETLKFLNPSLKRGFTPAGQKYQLRVPHGTVAAVEECLKNAGAPSDAITVKVQKGDSLWAISRRYGVSVADLCTVNNIKENGILSIGQTIIVPIME